MKKHLLSKWLFFRGMFACVPFRGRRPPPSPACFGPPASSSPVCCHDCLPRRSFCRRRIRTFCGDSFLPLPSRHPQLFYLSLFPPWLSLRLFPTRPPGLAVSPGPFCLFARSVAPLRVPNSRVSSSISDHTFFPSSALRSAASPLFGLLPSGLCHSPFALPRPSSHTTLPKEGLS